MKAKRKKQDQSRNSCPSLLHKDKKVQIQETSRTPEALSLSSILPSFSDKTKKRAESAGPGAAAVVPSMPLASQMAASSKKKVLRIVAEEETDPFDGIYFHPEDMDLKDMTISMPILSTAKIHKKQKSKLINNERSDPTAQPGQENKSILNPYLFYQLY